MKSTKLVCAGIAAILVAVAPVTPALAAFDTYLSIFGTDNNSCAISTPCQTMVRAMTETSTGGVLHCLDSNDYFTGNTITVITQSITIDCSNTTAAVGPFTINGSDIIVHFKGLTMPNVGPLIFQNGSELYVENCFIFGNAFGIQFSPTAAANLFVVNSTIRNNSGAGVLIKPSAGGSVTATFDRVTITNNAGGLKTDTTNGAVRVDISNSTISNNANNGLIAIGGAGGQNMVSVSSAVIASNSQAGIEASGANAAVLVNNTLLDSNAGGAGSAVSGGRILTYQNNRTIGLPGTGFTGTASPN